VFLRHLKQPLRLAYDAALTQNLRDEWRVGKQRTKLAQIDKSKVFDQPEYHKAKSFVKFEVNHKVPSKARLIQGNQNECTAYENPAEYRAISQALKMLSKETFNIEGVQFQLVYAGGYNHNDLSDLVTSWLHQSQRTLIDERDGKNWDSTMQEPTLKAERLVYEMLKLDSAKSFKARCEWVRGKISCKNASGIFRIYYDTVMKRLSGDWNTSVGNTIVSIIICVCTVLGLPVHLRPNCVRALFMGDDYLGFYSFRDLPDPRDLAAALSHGEALLGITPIRAIFNDPLHVSFISLGIWPRHNGDYQFVPHPARQLRKLMWAAKRLHPKHAEDYRSSLCIAFWPVYHGFPMMMKFLKLQYTKKNPKFSFDDKDSQWWLTPQTTVARDVNWRLGFMCKYELPFSALSFEWPIFKGCAVLHHPIVQYMLDIEGQDPHERVMNLSHPDHKIICHLQL